MSKNIPHTPFDSGPDAATASDSTLDNRNALNLKIAQQVSNLRKAKGWTGADLAREIGIPDAKFQQYESGTLPFQVAHLGQIARVLSVPVDQLLGIEPETDHTSVPIRGPTLDELYGLAHDFERIKSKARKRALLKLVQSIANSKMGRAG